MMRDSEKIKKMLKLKPGDTVTISLVSYYNLYGYSQEQIANSLLGFAPFQKNTVEETSYHKDYGTQRNEVVSKVRIVFLDKQKINHVDILFYRDSLEPIKGFRNFARIFCFNKVKFNLE